MIVRLLAASALVTACGDRDDSAAPPGHPALSLVGDAADGATVFATSCGITSCHGPDGSGADSNASDLAVAVPARSDPQLVAIIVEGTGAMVAVGLGDQEIADVLAYCRETFP